MKIEKRAEIKISLGEILEKIKGDPEYRQRIGEGKILRIRTFYEWEKREGQMIRQNLVRQLPREEKAYKEEENWKEEIFLQMEIEIKEEA